MSANYSICIGTIGTGAWLSPDSGDSWRRIASPNGLWGRKPCLRPRHSSERTAHDLRRRR